ncbi:hypothetical protein MHUMG1_07654 [Metarhizium humberi]|uniref:SnoaL-like domain-containing protein n=1 Tax=Metarhizium humberi TaxID=2596975 RepID=A0A9P8M8Q9_9HYPO|nr:Monooxygenase ptaG [Metarhizium anisopliae]KAH0594819.1 hypothetical protein MHUMG1_07654 [Metarhizium humberi]
MPAPAEVQAATIDKFIEGWGTNNPEAWVQLWTDDCTNKILPFSLGAPPMSKDTVVSKALPKLFGNLANWKLQVYEVVLDTKKSKAAIYATSKADTPFGDFKWANEYAAFVTLTEDGKQISKIEEMVDTAFFAEMDRQGAVYAAANPTTTVPA